MRQDYKIIIPISSFHSESLQSFCSDVFPPITTAVSGSIKHMAWFQRFDGPTDKGTKRNQTLKSHHKLGGNRTMAAMLLVVMYYSWSSGPSRFPSSAVGYLLCCSFVGVFSWGLEVGLRSRHYYSLYPQRIGLSDRIPSAWG